MSTNGAPHAQPVDVEQRHGHLRVVGGDQTIDLAAAEQANLPFAASRHQPVEPHH